MLWGDTEKFLSTFIDCEERNEIFNYNGLNDCYPDSYRKELHKFNHIFKYCTFKKGRLVSIFNEEIVLKKEDLIHLVKLYLYYKENDKNNSYLIAEFLLSYYTTISNNEYAKNVSNVKSIKNEFREILYSISTKPSLVLELSDDVFELYNKIIDNGERYEDFFYGDIIGRMLSNLSIQKNKKKALIERMLLSQKYTLKIIEYDDWIVEHVSYYEEFVKYLLLENTYYQYPEIIIYKLDNAKILSENLLDSLINDIVDRINIIQDRVLLENESFIRILDEIDRIIDIINRFLERIKSKSEIQTKKLKECINHILYIKRFLLSNEERIESQMNKFSYDAILPNEKITEFVNVISENLGLLYVYSCGNFIKRLEDSLNSYSQHALIFISNNFKIDSRKQVYTKSNEPVKDSIFKDYYELKGKEYIESHPLLMNQLRNDYYKHMLNCLEDKFKLQQRCILSFFDKEKGKRSLINLLMMGKTKLINNDYVLLASNVIEIEHIVIEIMKLKKMKYTKSGFNNLDELARKYTDNPIYFNGLMYVFYILYEGRGLNIRNNVAHGTYFNSDIEVELLTTFCAMMFLNNLYLKERGNYD